MPRRLLCVAIALAVLAPVAPAADAKLRPRRAEPVVKIPPTAPPERLRVRDVIVPKRGVRARNGDDVAVDYVGVAWSDGKVFDSSWDGSQPFSFTLGRGQLIPGFERAVRGMRVGGRRRVEMPPELAYGEQGSPPDIAPNETLVFVIDVRMLRRR